ncbi:MAG: hypothetical protein RLZ98_1487 [Pseudomonadota bacterium]|jgi:thiamine pyrophosphate-dependent acetolactate synthase large subunit-like protein
MMNRTAMLEILKKHLGDDEIVISSFSTASEWVEMSDRPLNYYFHGAMGLCSSHGLGLALARPERQVIVLDGDGGLLMNLGTLVTIAAAKPRNLIHFVCMNRTYEANGGHPIPNQQVDFAGIARSSGIDKVFEISDLADFEARLPGFLTMEGPAFVTLNIEQGPLGPRSYVEMYRKERRQAFRDALGAQF